MSFEVRHVSEHDEGRVAMGIRFENLRANDRQSLSRILLAVATEATV
jgi:hypothetical protein